MKRRVFLRSMVASGAGLVSGSSSAAFMCGPFVPPGVQRCDAGIDSTLANITAASQQNSNWCWAACISMVLAYYGHPVAQTRIVTETWGSIENLPAQPGQILANLNRQWIDDAGRRFMVAADPYSVAAVTAAQDLANGMPLIIGTQGHAVVLTALTYLRDAYGRGEVIAATVRDPWPGQGRRVLSPQEWFGISFGARIRVI